MEQPAPSANPEQLPTQLIMTKAAHTARPFTFATSAESLAWKTNALCGVANAGHLPNGMNCAMAAAEQQHSISLSDCENNVAEDSDYCQGEAESNGSLSDLGNDDKFLGPGRWGR